mmetsp:Transcript_3318/g.7041  ORF Transcript_3318/g.7041 Transcript_3318/m.7041 type:complete len:83 (-) Transcript_3318:50-298(-)
MISQRRQPKVVIAEAAMRLYIFFHQPQENLLVCPPSSRKQPRQNQMEHGKGPQTTKEQTSMTVGTRVKEPSQRPDCIQFLHK